MFGIKPDITSLGKIIGGGFPVGAVAGRKDVMSVFEPQGGQAARLPHGGTFNGNPITMVAGKAAMNEMTEEKFEQLNQAAHSLRGRVSEIFSELNIHGQVTGKGSLFALRFHKRPMHHFADIASTDEEILFMDRFRRYLISHGIWMGSGMTGCLSTATTEAHIEEFTRVLKSGIIKFKKDLPSS
jgi:glutamate-1-semialdehyde 2,1-aminomutase